MNPQPLPFRPEFRRTSQPAVCSLHNSASVFAAPAQEFVLEVEFQAAPGFTILFGPSGAGKDDFARLRCRTGHAGRGTHRHRRPHPVRRRAAHRPSGGEAARRIRLSEPRAVSSSDRGAERPIRPRPLAAGGACGSERPQSCRLFGLLLWRSATRARFLAEKASAPRWPELSLPIPPCCFWTNR